MKKKLSDISAWIKKRLAPLQKKTSTIITGRPFLSLFLILLGIFALIAVSSTLRKPKPMTNEKPAVAKNVSIYRIGAVPRINLQAQIDKSSVITITSLAGGVVQSIPNIEGALVGKGQTLVSLSTNYQGGNVFSLQRALAYEQYQNVKKTYDDQKAVLDIQREIAEENRDNTEELRKISEQSISETESLLGNNSALLTHMEALLTELEGIPNPDVSTQQAIIGLIQGQNQIKAANAQLNANLRLTRYQTDSGSEPNQLAELQEKLTKKQLDIQEQALKLSREVAKLQYQIAQVNEAVMYPAAPFTATIQKVFVRVGQAVQPGAPLVLLSGLPEEDPITAIIYAPREIAQSISRTEPTVLHFGNETYESVPSFVSTEAVQGTLYAVYYPIPDNYSLSLTDNGYVTADIPIGYPDTNAVIPFIPIDSVYQTETSAYVFVVEKSKAISRKVTLGQVMGRFVEVTSGLGDGDVVILDRTVIEGDTVKGVR